MPTSGIGIGWMRPSAPCATSRASMLIGADCATIPPKVLWQLARHPLTDRGLEAFLADWNTLGAEL